MGLESQKNTELRRIILRKDNGSIYITESFSGNESPVIPIPLKAGESCTAFTCPGSLSGVIDTLKLTEQDIPLPIYLAVFHPCRFCQEEPSQVQFGDPEGLDGDRCGQWLISCEGAEAGPRRSDGKPRTECHYQPEVWGKTHEEARTAWNLMNTVYFKSS